MELIPKISRIFALPYSGLLSVIFGIMILSFPIGVYIVFNSDVGKEINYQYPLDGIEMFFAGIGYKIPIQFEIGEAFIISWVIFLILFTISYIGPKDSFLKTLSGAISFGHRRFDGNSLVNAISWFSILILISVAIEESQKIFGVKIIPPESGNGLIHFFQITTAPLTEEIGFRVILIGIPLFLLYAQSSSWKLFFKSLWNPTEYLRIDNHRKIFALVITVGIFFGVAHIISGTPWSIGKTAQASIAGIILGWVYVRYGFAPAVLIHWATNYFLSTYTFFISSLNQNPTITDSSNPFSDTLEIIILVVGAIAIIVKILSKIESNRFQNNIAR